MRITRNGGGAARQGTLHEFVDPQLGGFEVHVSVDESGDDGRTAEVDRFEGLTPAPTGHHAVSDGEVGGDPFLGDGGEDATTGHEQVGWFVAPGHRQGSQRCGRA